MATFWADFLLNTLFLSLSSESFVSHGEVTEQLCSVLSLVNVTGFSTLNPWLGQIIF